MTAAAQCHLCTLPQARLGYEIAQLHYYYNNTTEGLLQAEQKIGTSLEANAQIIAQLSSRGCQSKALRDAQFKRVEVLKLRQVSPSAALSL